MDSSNNFLAKLQNWLNSLDEAYLVGIANRGLYNRALKELAANPALQLEFGADQVTCNLPDGTICILTNDLQKLRCSCPARGMCKHLLLCLLFLQQNPVYTAHAAEDEGPGDPGSKGDFSSLLQLSTREVRKLCGDKAYAECVFRLEFGIEAEVQEGSLLLVSFSEEDISVRFPPQDPLQNAICSCKSAAFCRHKAEALIHYQLAQGVISRQDLMQQQALAIPKQELGEIKKLLAEIPELGLARLPESVLDNLEQAAVLAHSADLPHIERGLRGLKGELELYFGKNSAFSREMARKRLSVLYSTILALEGQRADRRLVGEHKSAYYDIPPQEFYGLGAEGWNTKSGYEGITYYFYSVKLQRWLTYTNARPTYYDDAKVSLARMYKAAPPWNIAGTCEEFSKSRLSLINGKLNSQGRLSGSEQANGTILGLTSLNELPGNIIIANWEILLQRLAPGLSFSLFEPPENFNLALLRPDKWGTGKFDAIAQTFSLPLHDAAGRELIILIRFTKLTAGLINRLEHLANTGRYPEVLLGRVFLQDRNLTVYPLVAFFEDQGLTNLTLEAEDERRR